tara:strand:+ start:747 stop:1307 length:561 start_codon:yes stop_codon:yes gene_type:complete
MIEDKMKLTKQTLKQIIKEELSKILSENLSYRIERDEDLEMTSIVPSGVELSSSHYNEVAGDYSPTTTDYGLDEEVRRACEKVLSKATELGIGKPIVILAEPDDSSHVASTIDGTDTSGTPLICLNTDFLINEMNPEREATNTLLHEFGHIYFRTQGIEYREEEEDVVEEYALRAGNKSILDNYIQ